MAFENKAAHVRSIVKAFSWRLIGSLDTFVLSYILTGSGKWAISIASTEVLTKIVLYYIHERVWTRLRWGKNGQAHTRSLVKGVSWRVVGTIDTFVLSLIITGHANLAGQIASVEVFTKIALYYVHERVWTLIPFGRDAAPAKDAAPITDSVVSV